MRGRAATVLVAMLTLASAAQAADVVPSGSVVVRWQSNPATCSEHGLCDRSGTVSWRPARFGALLDFFGNQITGLDLLLGNRAVVRSGRTTATGRAVCVDDVPGPATLAIARSHGRFRFRMDGQAGVDSGRCAGPLASDLAAALPESRAVSAARLRNGGRIDMRSRRAFAAGPFEGEVVSTLVLRVRREISADGNAARRARSAAVHDRNGLLTLTYAVERMTGEIGFGFAGTRGPACGVFDVCEMTGDLAVRATDGRGTLVINSTRPLGSARRETAAAALSSLRAGLSRVDGLLFFGEKEDSYPPVTAKFPVVERAGFPDMPPCTDDGTLTVETLSARAEADGLSVGLAAPSEDPVALRTRCPGPMATDLADGSIASGVVPYSAMGDDRAPLALRPPGAFETLALGGSGHGAIEVELKLAGVKVETQ